MSRFSRFALPSTAMTAPTFNHPLPASTGCNGADTARTTEKPCPDAEMAKTISDMGAKLREDGWLHLPAAGARLFHQLTSALGEVIHTTDVAVKPASHGMVVSDRALDFHTDHSKADYVAWLCIRPAERGGETILTDARQAYAQLDAGVQQTLATVMLKEHRMFEGDPASSPLVFTAGGTLHFYYSFWLADKTMPEPQRQAFDAFRRAVARAPCHEFKLQHDDVLIVDNSFMLHGRRAIQSQNRRLTRCWIRSTCH